MKGNTIERHFLLSLLCALEIKTQISLCCDRERFVWLHSPPNIIYSSSGEEHLKCTTAERPYWHHHHHLAAAVHSELLQHRPDTHQDNNTIWIRDSDVNDFLNDRIDPLTLRIPSSREACCLSLTWAPAVMRARWSTAGAPGWGPRNPAGRRGSAAAGCPVRRSDRHLSDGCGGGGVRVASSLPPEWTSRF